MRTYLFLIILFLFYSCKEQKCNIMLVDVNKKELVKAIDEYYDYIETDFPLKNDGYPLYLIAYFKQINDSLSRYVINPIYYVRDLEYTSCQFITVVHGHLVFFTMHSNNQTREFKHPDIFLSKDTYMEIMKKYFPKDYEEELNINKYGKIYRKILNWDCKSYYLTLLRDSLIDKQLLHGWEDMKVEITIDGEKELY